MMIKDCARPWLLLLWPILVAPTAAQDLVVYDDALAGGFENWSWAEHDLENPAPVLAGVRFISFEADGWGAPLRRGVEDNLRLPCSACNQYKGVRTVGEDPESDWRILRRLTAA